MSGPLAMEIDSESSSCGPNPREAFRVNRFQGSHAVLHEIFLNEGREIPNEPMHLKAHTMRQTWDHQRYLKQRSSLRSLPQEGAPHPPGGAGICMDTAMICGSCCATLLRVGWLSVSDAGDRHQARARAIRKNERIIPRPLLHRNRRMLAQSGGLVRARPPLCQKARGGLSVPRPRAKKKAETRGSFVFVGKKRETCQT